MAGSRGLWIGDLEWGRMRLFARARSRGGTPGGYGSAPEVGAGASAGAGELSGLILLGELPFPRFPPAGLPCRQYSTGSPLAVTRIQSYPRPMRTTSRAASTTRGSAVTRTRAENAVFVVAGRGQ